MRKGRAESERRWNESRETGVEVYRILVEYQVKGSGQLKSLLCILISRILDFP